MDLQNAISSLTSKPLLHREYISKEQIDTARQNQSIKDNLLSLNYSKVNDLYKDIKNHFNPQGRKEFGKFLYSLQRQLKDGTYNIKGKVTNVEFSLYKGTNNFCKITKESFFTCLFELQSIEKDSNYIYRIKVEHIRDKLHLKLKKISKNTVMYFTNLRAYLEEKISSTKPQDNLSASKKFEFQFNLIFMSTLDSKMFIEQKPFCHIENNNNNINQSLHIQLNTNNELDFIESMTSSRISNLFKNLPSSYFDFTRLLEIEINSNIISTKHSHSFASIVNKNITICGLILNIYPNENQGNALVEIKSLQDANLIKLNIYSNKNLYCELKKNMIAIFNNYQLRLNNFFDITLKNGMNSYNELIGMVPTAELSSLYTNLLKTIPYNNLISLTSKPKVVRTISNYLIVIKQIIQITVTYEYNHNKIKNFPHLKLKAKFLIDDGTYEAFGYVNDLGVMTILGLTDEEMNSIIEKRLSKFESFLLYNKYLTREEEKCLSNETLKNILKKQFLIQAVPFMNIGQKKNKNNYEEYITGLLEDDEGYEEGKDLTDEKEDIEFVNGNIYIERNMGDQNLKYLARRPYMKILNIEEI